MGFSDHMLNGMAFGELPVWLWGMADVENPIGRCSGSVIKCFSFIAVASIPYSLHLLHSTFFGGVFGGVFGELRFYHDCPSLFLIVER